MIGHIEARNLLPAAAVLQALAPNTKLRLSVAKDYGDLSPTCSRAGTAEIHVRAVLNSSRG